MDIKKEINRIADIGNYAENGKMVDGWCEKVETDVKAALDKINFPLPKVIGWHPTIQRGINNPEPDYSGYFEFEGEFIYYKNPCFFDKIGTVEQTLAVWKWIID